MRESSDSPFIASSDWETLLMGIVVIRAIVVMVPFLMSFVLNMISFLMLILDPATCVSILDDVPQVLFISTMAALL
jgi:hypothetical protein